MSTPKLAYCGTDIFDGRQIVKNAALLTENGHVTGLVGVPDIPPDHRRIALEGGLIAPGFVDLQVNGGGGVMLNDTPCVGTIRRICDAHLAFGTTSLLPTLISDTKAKTKAALAAVQEAVRAQVPGVVGLHLEGPHLSQSRKGAHAADLIRPMQDSDLALLTSAAGHLPTLLTTIAPESVAEAQIAALSAAGIVVSIGHSDANYAQTISAANSGARCVTHLFNAMSQLGNRAPGVVGAALHSGALSAGLIADGIHVDPVTIATALRAKQGPGRIFLVTDAMATIGTDMREFHLNGRTIRRDGGCLTLTDGTLAGADLDMISAVRFMREKIGLSVEQALSMATYYPAEVIGRTAEIGQLAPGAKADFLLLDDVLNIRGVWRQGIRAI
jgi:N-acetylglucosamine-6-phosphate deacetylase